MITLNKYTPREIDIIKEIINIGGGNAATSISQLIDKPVTMSVPIIDIKNYEEVYEEAMAEDKMINGVIVRALGDAEGVFLFVIAEEVTEDIVDMMTPEGIQLNDELLNSGLAEFVNILISSFLNAVSKLLDINLISSVPLLIEDMFGAILSSLYIEAGQYDEDIMIIKNEFFYLGGNMETSLYFIPRPGILKELFKKIEV